MVVDMELNTIISFVIEIIVTTISIPGNILIIAVYKRKRRTSFSVLAIGLGIIDLVISLTSPVRLYNYLFFGKHTSKAYCQACGGIFYLGLNSSIFMAALIASNRYFAICKPHDYRFTPRASAVSVAISFGVSVLASLPLSVLFDVVSYPNDKFDCGMPQRLHLIATVYICFLTIFHILTIVVTLTMYGCVLRRVRRLKRVGFNRANTSDLKHNHRRGGGTEINETVLDGQAVNGKEKKDSISSLPVVSYPRTGRHAVANETMATCPVSSVHITQQVGPSTSEGPSNNASYNLSIPKIPTRPNRDGDVSAIVPIQTADEVLDTSCRRNVPRLNGDSPRAEATRKHLIVIMLLYLITWIPTLFIIIFGYKPEFRDTNYAAYTAFMVVCRFPGLNRIYHFGISFILRRSFRRDCKDLLLSVKLNLF
ncbi:thyrotropin-releasing hormone receptor-like [Lytechinus variegatus]|uniref:thyrotropin-releasing hormone receptor-like n=1 Tax=Lytechinus variegatus TaxID=7654 RepID=UPI001BB1AF16|nr:thyrotropin-releasing hormone receptor-like [Lytechinus variegatus]